MKYEALKERVADHVCYGIENYVEHQGLMALCCYAGRATEAQSVWAVTKELSTLARGIVMAWDVRCVGRLRDLFPQAWPRNLQGPLAAYMDDRGDWVVERA